MTLLILSFCVLYLIDNSSSGNISVQMSESGGYHALKTEDLKHCGRRLSLKAGSSVATLKLTLVSSYGRERVGGGGGGGGREREWERERKRGGG